MNLYPMLGLGLLVLAGCSPATQQHVVADGQLFCGKATLTGPLVVAVVNAMAVDAVGAAVPVVVTGMTANAVAAICASIAAIPVSPPSNPTTAPVVAVVVPPA